MFSNWNSLIGRESLSVDPIGSERYLISINLKIKKDKIAFMPFGYLMDLWRWDVFDGTTPRLVLKLVLLSYWLKNIVRVLAGRNILLGSGFNLKTMKVKNIKKDGMSYVFNIKEGHKRWFQGEFESQVRELFWPKKGIVAPVERTAANFDPAAKFHIPNNTPYIRYFIRSVSKWFYQSGLWLAK